jgi:2-pyrone-4,6-dicarboxylate lactonase
MATQPLVIPAADPKPRAPGWAVRAGGWDTHAHVFGPFNCYPLPAERAYTPPEQTADDYVAMLDALGIAHGVLVQPSVYGTDHSCMLDAMARHPGSLFGIVDLDVTTLTDTEAERLTRLGVLGMRMRWPNPGGVPWLREVVRRLRALGWHLDLLPKNFAAMAEVAPYLRGLNIPIMIEAMGHPDPGEPASSPGFHALLGLARAGIVSVKLSHPYHIDPSGLPYPAARVLARTLAATAPAQLVWGSDWPHPMPENRMPNDGDLLDLLPGWAGSVDAANAMLVDNARRFYTGA